jgi:DNA polymerase I-like protein with 3'-5' exonuclease and polymerase domains
VALQGIEAVLMKLAMLLWQAETQRLRLDAHFIAFVHDEVQINAHKDCAEKAGELMCACIRKAGEMLRLNTPMDGDYIVGTNWSMTH